MMENNKKTMLKNENNDKHMIKKMIPKMIKNEDDKINDKKWWM